MDVATKTIALREEAYVRLKRLKGHGESFSDVVMRLSGRPDLLRYAGCISEESAQELERIIAENRGRLERDFQERFRRIFGG